ncbi:MAG: DUF4038 domain-containing protein, partial [Bacteroidales bacterium]|nr:DUF4038 domain-containing protein [Bacteroidales bacterium]
MMKILITSGRFVGSIRKKSLLKGLPASLFLLTFLFTASCFNTALNNKRESGLTVSNDGHSLIKDGKPFFWLGDTGWLILKESPENIDTYFSNRVKNGFNVIQLMITRRMFNDE